MTYKLTFLQSAKKEWDRLDNGIRQVFKKKLIERRNNPHVVKHQLSNLESCYKIKLRVVGYRLIYKVFDGRKVIQIIAIGKRDKSFVYEKAKSRLD